MLRMSSSRARFANGRAWGPLLRSGWLAVFCLLIAPVHGQTDPAEPTTAAAPADSAAGTSTETAVEPAAGATAASEVGGGELEPTTTDGALEPSNGDAPLEPATPALSATEASQAYLAATEQQYGHNSLPTAEAFTGLAEAQRAAGDHNAAAEAYLAAIEIYRAVDGPFTGLALAPLVSLADNYNEAGKYAEAVSAYGEARVVSRRAFGLLNEEQIPLLDRLSETLLGMNEPAEAEAQQVEALRIVERNWPPESPQALAAIYKYADWLAARYEYQRARDQYSRALRTVRDVYGKEDARQVEALLGIGNSFREQRIPESQGYGALEDALALLEAAPERDPLALATVLRDLGDWQVAFGKVGYDGAEYRRAWQLLGEVADGDTLKRQWFSGPNFVLREPLSVRDISADPTAPEGYVLSTFDLHTNGETYNVAVADSKPAGLKDEAVLRNVRRSRFRPQMANGEIVEGTRLALRFTFRYEPESVASEE